MIDNEDIYMITYIKSFVFHDLLCYGTIFIFTSIYFKYTVLIDYINLDYLFILFIVFVLQKNIYTYWFTLNKYF